MIKNILKPSIEKYKWELARYNLNVGNIMKNYLLLFTLFLLIGISTSYSVTASEHNGYNLSSMSLEQEEKWPIDESLHKGMVEIHALMVANIADIHQDKFTKKQYKTLTDTLQTQINYLFENCVLPSGADMQLHILLSKMIKGVSKMNTSNEQLQGAIQVIQGLQNYSVYFDDPHWDNLSH
tara:strand:- start:19898 stop:20440 length:543 start_codon:yes stop_codon:yes gene_type:complete